MGPGVKVVARVGLLGWKGGGKVGLLGKGKHVGRCVAPLGGFVGCHRRLLSGHEASTLP